MDVLFTDKTGTLTEGTLKDALRPADPAGSVQDGHGKSGRAAPVHQPGDVVPVHPVGYCFGGGLG